MIRRIAICFLATALLPTVYLEAQQAKQMYRIAILSPATRPRPVIDAFRQRMRELGYTENQNVAFEDRYAEFKVERLPELASELVKLKPDVIFTHSVTGASGRQASYFNHSNRYWSGR
jgi:putative ABC transport system substrate-binding protein